jgi:DUF1680 family protein
MPVQRMHAHPLVQADVGRVSLRRGPLVYCVEQADHPDAAIALLRLPGSSELKFEKRDDLFDGIVTVVADGEAATADPGCDPLYTSDSFATRPARLTASTVLPLEQPGRERDVCLAAGFVAPAASRSA